LNQSSPDLVNATMASTYPKAGSFAHCDWGWPGQN
jgi:hypothetical protein